MLSPFLLGRNIMLKRTLPQLREPTISTPRSIKPLGQACALALAATFALTAGPAVAGPSIARQEAQLQLKADQAGQASEQLKLKADEQTLKADTRSGRMAAESPDAEKVYRDQMYLKGEKKDLAADKSGSLQMKEDKTALASDRQQLKMDRTMLAADTRSGKMAAESKDADAVYNDHQYLRGEKKDIAADKAKLEAH
ncbi:MAG: hypothetical protein WBA83_00040 [Burkholderiaceae bacterium]